MSSTKSKIHSNQTGLVSYLVVSVLMIVLTIIVLSFARSVQREQSQSLDRQLNTQALYAAESGVNDALNALAADTSGTLASGTYNECHEFIEAPDPDLNNDLGNGVSYSCLLLDSSPPELKFDINSSHSTTTLIRAENDEKIDTINISWKDAGGLTNVSGCAGRPDSLPSSCGVGYLRVEMVAFEEHGGTDPVDGSPIRVNHNRDALLTTKRAIGFLRPHASAAKPTTRTFGSLSDAQQGRMVNVACNGGTCEFRLSGLNIIKGYLRLRSIYKDVEVTVTASGDGSQKNFIGAQAAIDSTGRAGGVVKRIKVYKSLNSGVGMYGPEAALQSKESICKRYKYISGSPGSVSLSKDALSFDTPTEKVCSPLEP